MRLGKKLVIVIPCYNESEVLPETMPLFIGKLDSLKEKGLVGNGSRILLVDDGSSDTTWELIEGYATKYESVVGIHQSRNRGHQNAVYAGMMEAQQIGADVVITIDCDGQDDLDAMDEMLTHYHDGCDVVYGVRDDRTSDSLFKRHTAQGFYKVLSLMGVESIYNHADYRLMSSRVISALSDFKEVNLYLRGILPLIGFKSTVVNYKRTERIAGESHYPFSKMLGLAVDGITSLSIKPIRLVTLLGLIVTMLGLVLIGWVLYNHLIGNTVSGWSSTYIVVCFMGGVQLVSLGVIGEYVGKIYLEVKGRPKYIIDKRTDNK